MISLVSFLFFKKKKKRPITLLLDKSPFVPIITCSRRALMWASISPHEEPSTQTNATVVVGLFAAVVVWCHGRNVCLAEEQRIRARQRRGTVTSRGLIHSSQTGYWPAAELRDSEATRRCRRKTTRFWGMFGSDHTCENTVFHPRRRSIHGGSRSSVAPLPSFYQIMCIKERVWPKRGGSRLLVCVFIRS